MSDITTSENRAPVVFCETNAVLCPALSLTQYIIGKRRLVTLIGEQHDGLCDPRGSTYKVPHDGVSVTEYVAETLKSNPNSVVLLEVGPSVCFENMKSIGSRPIRELACLFENTPLEKRVYRFNMRYMLLRPEEMGMLYCNNLIMDFKSSDGITRKYTRSVADVERFIYKGPPMDELAAEFVDSPNMVLPGPISDDGHEVLARQSAAIQAAFEEVKPSVEVYKQNLAHNLTIDANHPPDMEWWKTHIVEPLKAAWGMVADYFAIRAFFTENEVNEMIVVVGQNHIKNINRRMDAVRNTVRIKTGYKRQEDQCVRLNKLSGQGERLFGTVVVDANVCETINKLKRKPKQTILPDLLAGFLRVTL